jgi:Kef-type K+ transport system membrane component KefB
VPELVPTGHGDPVAGLLLSLAVILVIAKFGGHIAARLGQPAVLGELVGGLLLGNLTLVGVNALEHIKTDPGVDMLARLGVLLLLFQIGIDETVGQMLKVGLSSFFVATLGVIGPFALGWVIGVWLLPDASAYTHAFLAATLTATSVGITARVLKDLGRARSQEARIILGAAVIDDVQGLIILAVVTGLVASAAEGQPVSYPAIAMLLLKAGAFLVGSLLLGVIFSPRLFSLASRLQAGGVLLATGLALCFFVAWLADRIGLAPIVGAFAAGLVLEDLHFRDFVNRGERTLAELIEPITSFLMPIFFVVIGLRTDLRAFAHGRFLGLMVVLTVAAIAGKLLSSLGVVGRGLDRLSIGIGMVPRGEVGLIFANIGLTLSIAGRPIVDQSLFAVVVAVVMATTLLTPPALKWSFERFERRRRPTAPRPETTSLSSDQH